MIAFQGCMDGEVQRYSFLRLYCCLMPNTSCCSLLLLLVQSVPSVIADADDSSSLNKLASETDVIIATAGPFAKYGSKVVAAAVEQGTHYCDITGRWRGRR